ncbi:hypothetical protein [Streptomyces sp. NPDC089919]|uniref:hypothetical protein n=1 Tax=Streptomyces sp. NPDC089919 TaxID=3155188 RepID=UPI0034412628
MNLRLIGIGAGVLIALSLPLAAATAGPLSEGGAGGLLATLGLGGSDGSGAGHGAGHGVQRPGRAPAPAAGHDAAPGAGAEDAKGQPAGTRCGPELSSPEGVEGQTCVLAEGARTWARTYYRNATGRPLDAVLTLMAPAGRTVRITCAVAAGDEPGICETPREPAAGEPEEYSAVAEFAVPDGNGPLLLRAGSNSRTTGDG